MRWSRSPSGTTPLSRGRQQATFGDIIAGDTQAILAWVKENNPKVCIKEGRLDKTRQPTANPNCKLGVKVRRNHAPADADGTEPATPTTDATPARQLQVGVEILWGYASGIVVTALPDGTEVVLAERTRPFNESDPSYFHPLMQPVEARLGRQPRFGAWDCAFDAHYVYDYFHQAGGFAAVPFNPGRKGTGRQFSEEGIPAVRGSAANGAAVYLPAPHGPDAAPAREVSLSTAVSECEWPDMPDCRCAFH